MFRILTLTAFVSLTVGVMWTTAQPNPDDKAEPVANTNSQKAKAAKTEPAAASKQDHFAHVKLQGLLRHDGKRNILTVEKMVFVLRVPEEMIAGAASLDGENVWVEGSLVTDSASLGGEVFVKVQRMEAVGWISLFDGKSLGGWKVADKYSFAEHGKVAVSRGLLTMAAGSPATGIHWTEQFPQWDYELTFDAQRTGGNDFFCGLTFPVGKAPCTLILGGWGGSLIGLSNVDGHSAAENETTCSEDFTLNQWYRIRLRVTKTKIEAWVDSERVIDLEIGSRQFSIWWEQEPMKPLGIATWYTSGAIRGLRYRRLAAVKP